jgi:hypothetical protein
VSWDVSICKVSRVYASMEEIGEDERCFPLGSRAEVQAAVSSVFGATDWSDPNWGVYEAPFGSVEFNLGGPEPMEGLMLHVRASTAVIAPIVEMCLKHGWQALDTSNGEFLEQSPVPEAGLVEWLQYRARVLGQPDA